MLKIKIHSKSIVNFTGLTCINVDNTTKYLQKLFQYETTNSENVFLMDGINISIKDCLIISPLTKMETLYNFTTKSILNKMVNNYDWNINKILNFNYLKNVANDINSKIGVELLNVNESPSKIFKSMLDVENNQFIHPEQLYKFLKNSESVERQTIILVDFDDISVAELFKYISNFNIIILTNNAFDLVKSPEEVPLINFIDKNYKTLEFIETQEIFRYFVEEYFQKDFDIIDVEHIFNKEFMENMKISIFLK